MKCSKMMLFFLGIIVFVILFYALDKKISSKIQSPKIINPYKELTNSLFLKEQLGEYAKYILIKNDKNYYVNRHPANSPDFFSEIYNYLPPKESDELRIVFFGNSQLFQVQTGDRIPIPFRTEQLLQKKVKSKQSLLLRNKKIRVLNLSIFGMNTSEILITSTTAIPKLNPDIIVLAITPRDFANEETKTMGIAPQYSLPILEPNVIKNLIFQHFTASNLTNIDLFLESLVQLSRVWQRDFNQKIDQSIARFWSTYQAKSTISKKINEYLLIKIQASSLVPKIEANKIKSPSQEKPLYDGEIYPNVRSEQFKILLHFLKQNFPNSVLIYNEPLRPKTINLYFTETDYLRKVNFIRENSKKNGFEFIDLNGQLPDRYFDDWIHLNPEGVNEVSTILTDRIYQNLINHH